jgi:uncharacterized membrane protein
MDPAISGMMESLFRWIHVVVGVLWIGLLYFFNWVNGPFGAKLDAETKQKAMPELLPRTLYFFRWGAAFTWITGLLLLGLVFYMGKIMVDGGDAAANTMAMWTGLGVVFVGAAIYDVLWKFLQDKQTVGVAVSFVLVCGIMYCLQELAGFSSRALYIHIGALFGTAMAMNVWMRIWPAQRKIITAIKAGDAPEPAWGALAGLRSKHNTYMSIPLIFMMLNSHDQPFFEFGWPVLAVATAVGWAVCYWVYKKSKTDVCATY